MRLRPIPVTHPAHVESMRRTRNHCASGFANYNGQITVEQQERWWAENKDSVRAWLYADDTQGTKATTVIVGFGLIRQHDDGRWFTTVGILPEYAGHDFGKEVTAHLIAQVPGKCHGIARRDNPAAVKLHVASDWQVIEGPDPALVYFRTWREGSLEQVERRLVPSTPVILVESRVGEHLADAKGNGDNASYADRDQGRGDELGHVANRQCQGKHQADRGGYPEPGVKNQSEVAHSPSVAEPWPPEGSVEQWSEVGWVTT